VTVERMRVGYWLGLVLRDPFSALAMMDGWQQGRPTCKKNHSSLAA